MHARGGRIVVELAGLAGAGKTTLARELAQDPVVQLGLPVSRARSAVAQAEAVAACAVPYVGEAWGSTWFTRDQVRGLAYLRAWRGALGRASTGPHWVVMDHGPLFRLAQLDAFGPPVTSTVRFRRWWDETLDAYASLLDVVVWVDAPQELLVRRIRSRDQRHVLRESDDETAQLFLGRYRAAYERVLDRVRRRSPGTVVNLRTDVETPAVLAQRVRRRIGLEAAQVDV